MQSDETTLAQNTSEAEKPKDILQQMADFIVNVEFSRQLPLTDKYGLQSQLQEKEQRLNQQLRDIQHELIHFRQIMTRAGAMQWRHETEKLACAGKTELQQLEEVYRSMRTTVTAHCEKLNRASMGTVKNVAQLVSTTRSTDLKKLTVQKSHDLAQACTRNLQRVDYIVQTFHWRNLVLTVLLTLIVSVIVSLYIDDEWPWQTHAQIVKQREAGKILLNSWPQLSHNDQSIIIENA